MAQQKQQKLDYRTFFNLTEFPYNYIRVNPRYFYNKAPQHRLARAILETEVLSKMAHIYLTGSYGSGKTMIMKVLKVDLENDDDNRVFYTLGISKLTDNAFLRRLCQEMQIKTERSYIDTLANFEDQITNWAKQGKTPILLIDDAHKLAASNLSVIHHIMNFVTANRLLIVVVLAGQEKLVKTINRKPEVKSRMHALSIDRLSLEDTSNLIHFRWRVASNETDNPLPFDDQALNLIYDYTDGLPRDICTLCDRSLMYAKSMKQKVISGNVITAAAKSNNMTKKKHAN